MSQNIVSAIIVPYCGRCPEKHEFSTVWLNLKYMMKSAFRLSRGNIKREDLCDVTTPIFVLWLLIFALYARDTHCAHASV